MIYARHLRQLVIQPALHDINLYTVNDEQFLMRICAQESLGGYYLKQLSESQESALGIYQMQPNTHDSIWNTTISKNPNLEKSILETTGYQYPPLPEDMVYNLQYATIMARVFWLHVKEPTPDANDIDSQWNLYKKYWNTEAGK